MPRVAGGKKCMTMSIKDIKPDGYQLLRMKAEERLTEMQKEKSIPALEVDTKKLLHEIMVHQIELEMQNEELQQSYGTAEMALKKYTMLYDFAPMGYFTLNKEAGICDLNFTGADLLGAKRFSLVNSNFRQFVSTESINTFNAFFKKIYSVNSKESCEIILAFENNPLCRVYIEGIVTGNERECLLSAVDISYFKKIDQVEY